MKPPHELPQEEKQRDNMGLQRAAVALARHAGLVKKVEGEGAEHPVQNVLNAELGPKANRIINEWQKNKSNYRGRE